MVGGYNIDFTHSDRRGWLAVPKPHITTAPAVIKRAREASLGVKGCRLFNLLPPALRNMQSCTIDQFKFALDSFLSKVPDQPTIQGEIRAAETNSLVHQIHM